MIAMRVRVRTRTDKQIGILGKLGFDIEVERDSCQQPTCGKDFSSGFSEESIADIRSLIGLGSGPRGLPSMPSVSAR